MTCPYVGGSDIEPREREYAPTLAQSSSRTVGKIGGRYFYTIGTLPEFLARRAGRSRRRSRIHPDHPFPVLVNVRGRTDRVSSRV